MPTATAYRQSLYDAHSLKPSAAADKQFVAFTRQSMQISAGHSIRKQVQRLTGSDPGAIRPTSTSLLDRFTEHATQLSESITTTYNSMLDNAIKGIPASATDAEAQQVVNDFKAAAHTYNQQTLIPWTASTARQEAVSQFYRENGLTESAPWVWTRNTDAPDDECQDAADASPAAYADLLDIAGSSPPIHQNCQCSLDIGDVSPDDVPSDLWMGD